MKSIRMLIVEDDLEILKKLKSYYRAAFESQGFSSVTIEQAEGVEEARDLARQAKGNPYDLVSLDVILGDSQSTGMDVLDSLKRFRSAWMVAMLTGVETDRHLDAQTGMEKAEQIRRDLRRDAYGRFPAERLMVVEKPSTTLSLGEADELLENRIRQIALIYEEIGRLRYIFRPIDVVSLERVKGSRGKKDARKFNETTSIHWQIRFNCGEIRTLPHRMGLKTLHHLLSKGRDESLPADQALAIEPKTEREETVTSVDGDPVAAYFESQGVQWNGLSESEQEKLIRAALSLRFKEYVDLRGYQEEDDISPDEEDRLARLSEELGPLATAAEVAYQRLCCGERGNAQEMGAAELAQNQIHVGNEMFSKEQGRRGFDSPAAANFRKRMERTRDYLRENGFADFADHLESYLMPNRANWSYITPNGVEWTTS